MLGGRATGPGSDHQSAALPAGWCGAKGFTSLGLSFLVCQMGTLRAPAPGVKGRRSRNARGPGLASGESRGPPGSRVPFLILIYVQTTEPWKAEELPRLPQPGWDLVFMSLCPPPQIPHPFLRGPAPVPRSPYWNKYWAVMGTCEGRWSPWRVRPHAVLSVAATWSWAANTPLGLKTGI